MPILGIHNKPLKSPSLPFGKRNNKKIKMIVKKGKRGKKSTNVFTVPTPKPTPISLKPKFGSGVMVFGANAGKGTRTVASRMRSR